MFRERHHRCWPAIAAWFALACLGAGRVGAAEPPLTRAIDIRSLSPEQAAQGLAATLRGTVIFVEPTLVFVQDETAGTYFLSANLGVLRPGDEVEVTGRTHLGIFLPGLDQATFRILRRGTLPPAIAVSYEDLVSGRYHYQRVAVDGIVRSVTALGEGRTLLRIAFSSRVFDVWVEAAPEKERLLVDSLVRVKGLAVGTINSRRQLVQPYLRAMDWSEIEIVKPGPRDEEVPTIAPADLLTFRVARREGNRVRVSGVVTASFAHGMVYLRNDRTPLGARLAIPMAVELGDRVEVLGFPEMNRFSASLVDAQIIERKPGPPPAPVEVRIEDLFRGTYDGDLVTVTAIVADSYRRETGIGLVLQDDQRRVGVVNIDLNAEVPPVGSLARVTGISRVNLSEGVGYSFQPEAIAITVRTAADIVVLRSPPWWTVRRLSLFLSVLVGAVLLAGLWIALLRRQVQRQAAVSRRQIESEAALEERQRLAREFHDTLEQELVGLGLRLDAVATRSLDDKGRSLVEASRSLVGRIQSETRNLVADLRNPCSTAFDLASALEDMTDLKSADGRANVRIEEASALPLLPVGAVHNLRMIARESVTNALKHSGATEIVVRLNVEDDARIVMTITDNGRGFDVAQETCGKSGHFGCVGIRERCGKLGAEVVWRSGPGRGATVEVTLPLPRVTADNAGSVPVLVNQAQQR